MLHLLLLLMLLVLHLLLLLLVLLLLLLLLLLPILFMHAELIFFYGSKLCHQRMCRSEITYSGIGISHL